MSFDTFFIFLILHRSSFYIESFTHLLISWTLSFKSVKWVIFAIIVTYRFRRVIVIIIIFCWLAAEVLIIILHRTMSQTGSKCGSIYSRFVSIMNNLSIFLANFLFFTNRFQQKRMLPLFSSVLIPLITRRYPFFSISSFFSIRIP